MTRSLIVVCRVTTRCNLSCGFCAFDRRLPFARATLDAARIERLIDLLARHHADHWPALRSRHADSAAPLLSWLGGEPLLWHDWTRFSALARSHRLAVSTTTNGTTLQQSPVRADVLALLDELTISVDAIGATHDRLRGWPGGYRRTLDAIERLAQERTTTGSALRLRANIVLMRSTIDQFAALTRQLADVGIDEISFNLLGGRDRPDFHALEAVARSDFERFLQRLPEVRAGLARSGVNVIGGSDYEARLRSAVRGQPWPVADCAPGSQFLFVEENGMVAPCAFTGADYGIPIEQIDALAALPAQFRAARSRQRAAVCSDCPSTQVCGKFARAAHVVDLVPDQVATIAAGDCA